MKILCLTPVYPHAGNPTEGLFNEAHARALHREGAEVTVVVVKQWLPNALARRVSRYRSLAGLPMRENREGIEILFCRYLHLPRYQWPNVTASSCARAVLRALERHRVAPPDVIQAQSAWPTGMAAVKVAARLQRPFVVTFHIEDDPRLIRRASPRGLYGTMLRRAAALVVVGSPLERALQRLLPKGASAANVLRIANGTDLRAAQISMNEVKERSGWGHLVSVCNLWTTKGIHLNLEALARLSARGVTWRSYTVVGDGPERRSLEALARRLGIADKVEFTGRLHHREALRRIAAAQIFSLPSWQESFGMVYLEAMASGKPVVGVRGQGAEDIIRPEKDGLLVSPQDVDGLAAALERLLGDERLARDLGTAGERRAQEFTWEKNAGQYLELYRSIR